WGVIAPFNFPAALSAGPAGAALTAGNTVVLKPADDAPLTSYLIAQCFHDAGLPAGPGSQLLASLAAANLTPDDIDMVVITHGDSDHIGGLGSFPASRIVMASQAYKLWTEDTDGMVEEFVKLFRDSASAEELAAQATGRRAYYDVLMALEADGRLTLVEPGEEIIAGLSLRPAPGHRRDQMAVVIQSG
ncbi:MAG: aldehyde dehydrogenase family protein, partial [Anaerolineales bacterium]|nr:aldehyde dehydrogenase family protein [Anaerolineales bacterium]